MIKDVTHVMGLVVIFKDGIKKDEIGKIIKYEVLDGFSKPLEFTRVVSIEELNKTYTDEVMIFPDGTRISNSFFTQAVSIIRNFNYIFDEKIWLGPKKDFPILIPFGGDSDSNDTYGIIIAPRIEDC